MIQANPPYQRIQVLERGVCLLWQSLWEMRLSLSCDPGAAGVSYNQDQVRAVFWFEETVKMYVLLVRPVLASGACCVAHGIGHF